jgi:hypothetical protein
MNGGGSYTIPIGSTTGIDIVKPDTSVTIRRGGLIIDIKGDPEEVAELVKRILPAGEKKGSMRE